jgi:hypothetical protein
LKMEVTFKCGRRSGPDKSWVRTMQNT